MFVSKMKIATTIMILAVATSGVCLLGYSADPPAPIPPTPPSDGELPITKNENGPPQMTAEEIVKLFPDGVMHDFGIVPSGQLAYHSFRIVNTSNVPLRIISVRYPCDRSKAKATKQVLQPNEEGTVDIALDTRRFRGPKTCGPFVTLDNGRMGEARLMVHADSRPDITCVGNLDFGKIQRGASPTTQMNVGFAGHPQLQVTAVKCDSKYIQVKLRESARGMEETIYEVIATVGADLPEGIWHSDVQLSTDDPTIPRFTVPLTVEVESQTARPK